MGGEALKTARSRYAAPVLWSLSTEDVRELLGPAESQYTMTTTAANCLPLGGGGDTVQDNWQFAVPSAPTRVTIGVDVVTNNQGCQTINCATAPDPTQGPLDPKFALYPPGIAPSPGPFNGFTSPDCGVTPDTGCGVKPVDACFICDNTACTDATNPGQVCGTLVVDLTQSGGWTVAVAPQPPGNLGIPQAEGCYVLTVTAEPGKVIGNLRLVGDDVTVTFRTQR